MNFAPAGRAERGSAASERVGSETDSCIAVRLLEHGTSPSELKCLACASEFPRPSKGSQRFGMSLRFAGGSSENDEVEGRLFVGDTVTLASVNRSLSAELDGTSVYVGEPLIVGFLERGPQASGLALFCEDCGLNIASHASETSRPQYAVDRLVELIPERFARRKGTAQVTREDTLADPRVRAYFFARQIIEDGGCSRREMCIRALRAQVPLAEVEAALMAMGAKYGVRDGDVRVIADESQFFGQVSSDPSADDAPQHALRAAPAMEARPAASLAERTPRPRQSILRTLLQCLRPEPSDLDGDCQAFCPPDLGICTKDTISRLTDSIPSPPPV